MLILTIYQHAAGAIFFAFVNLVRGDFASQAFHCKTDLVLTCKNLLSLSCIFSSVIHGLFVGFYGVFLSLVIPDENKQMHVL